MEFLDVESSLSCRMNLIKVCALCLFLSILIRAGTSFAQTPILFGLTSEGGINNQGTIIKINGDGSAFSVVHLFEQTTGFHPVGSVVKINSMLYGITAHGGLNNAGTLFSFDPQTNLYTVLYDFNGPTGTFALFDNFPSLLSRIDGKLYGAAPNGGDYNLGVIFSFEVTSGIYTVLYSFNPFYSGSPYGSVIDPNDSGKLFGLVYSNLPQLYSYDINSSTYGTEYDMPGICETGIGSMMKLGNKLYGVGGQICPFIFSYDLDVDTLVHLYEFSVATDGGTPTGRLTLFDSQLFGTADGNGVTSRGVIFKTDTLGNFSKLFDFPMYLPDSTSGEKPLDLMLAANGQLYGMTHRGGLNDYGVIYTFDPITNQYQKLHDFAGVDGMSPIGGLTEIDSTVGVKEINHINFSIYPNPVISQFSLIMFSPLYEQSLIVIRDIFGRELKKIQLARQATHMMIDGSEFSAGVYFLTLENINGTLTYRFVKQ